MDRLTSQVVKNPEVTNTSPVRRYRAATVTERPHEPARVLPLGCWWTGGPEAPPAQDRLSSPHGTTFALAAQASYLPISSFTFCGCCSARFFISVRSASRSYSSHAS